MSLHVGGFSFLFGVFFVWCLVFFFVVVLVLGFFCWLFFEGGGCGSLPIKTNSKAYISGQIREVC